MSEKPSYLGLLNAVSNAESQAECYLNAWAGVTPDDGVRQVISTRRAPRGRARQGIRKASLRARLHAAPPRGPEVRRQDGDRLVDDADRPREVREARPVSATSTRRSPTSSRSSSTTRRSTSRPARCSAATSPRSATAAACCAAATTSCVRPRTATRRATAMATWACSWPHRRPPREARRQEALASPHVRRWLTRGAAACRRAPHLACCDDERAPRLRAVHPRRCTGHALRVRRVFGHRIPRRAGDDIRASSRAITCESPSSCRGSAEGASGRRRSSLRVRSAR